MKNLLVLCHASFTIIIIIIIIIIAVVINIQDNEDDEDEDEEDAITWYDCYQSYLNAVIDICR